MPTALITGATAGIGAAFAERLAGDGYDLVLVARDGDRLLARAAALRSAHGVAAETLAADLSCASERVEVEHRLGAELPTPVDLLVNNAGTGGPAPMWELPVERVQGQFDLNATAVLRLTHAVLPRMLARRSGAVINVASLGGLLPGRNGVAYTAEKVFAVTLSQGLAAALEGTGVRVLALCPGFTRTELHERVGFAVGERSSGWWLDPHDVVDRALRDLRRGRVVSVPGARYRALVGATDLLPHGMIRRITSRMERRRRDGAGPTVPR